MSLAAPIEYTDAAQMLADYAERRKAFYPVTPQVKAEPRAPLVLDKPPVSGSRWTADEVEALRTLVADGLSKKAIARRMGRSPGGVGDYAGKLGLRFTRSTAQRVRSMAREAKNCRLVFERVPESVRRHEQGRYILGQVAADCELLASDLTGDSRTAPIVAARQQAMWLCARDTPLSLPAIGRIFNRDHTTVLHAIRRENDRRGENVRGMGGYRR